MVLVLQRCLRILYVRIAQYIIPSLLLLFDFLIHVELRNCPVPGTNTFGPLHLVERSSSVVECQTRNPESPCSNPPLLPFRRLGIFRSVHRRPCSLSCINEYLAIDSGGNVSDLVLARNCCLARMLPGEAENGVGMNRSAREGKKCEAL